MASNNVGIGGNVLDNDASEALNEIPQNRTLVAGKLTPNTPIKPEAIEGLRTVDEVFDHFSPELNLQFEDKEGGSVNETIQFDNLGSFGKKGITQKSDFLKGLEIESEQYKKIIKQLKTNKVLKQALQDKDAKESLVTTLEMLIAELSAAK
ncbi:hypothetical protein D1816_08490 [Aquimarina sp. AD10]|uniref:Type VI secretion protein n=1 Tax=Aquimarina aggregata TaxID=1642818 RepID=A0A162Y2N3_9FLAO|nr:MULTISPECIES: hypothetical protein [Aquimarina]AXT60384.1 hypothetical protein D1816_08490 [Aquimarina sp. AD10]KZS38901.1 hypothetical protein AWE51_15075 [Aquimarina aggregata]RKN01181.1 hypothetical protein D7033_04995 [Aquimarina sp. AD10]